MPATTQVNGSIAELATGVPVICGSKKLDAHVPHTVSVFSIGKHPLHRVGTPLSSALTSDSVPLS